MVFVYTDGVSEATNEALDDFTDQRLAASLRSAGALWCREIPDCVTRELLAFTDGAPQSDDITMLSLRILWPTERSEAFGIVQIEAMAAGLPVVNTQLDTGVPFVSVHKQTGLTVPPGDSDQLAAAINRLLDNPELAAAFGRAASLRAKQEFAADVRAARTLSLYERVTHAGN